MAVNIDHGQSSSFQCLTGVVFIRPTNLIGATNGVLFTNGISIQIRQVPGPSLHGPSLSSMDGRFATVCGTFIPDMNQAVFNVTTVIPRGGAIGSVVPGTSSTIGNPGMQ